MAHLNLALEPAALKVEAELQAVLVSEHVLVVYAELVVYLWRVAVQGTHLGWEVNRDSAAYAVSETEGETRLDRTRRHDGGGI